MTGQRLDGAGQTPAIHVVGANPALDRLQVVPRFSPHLVNRAERVVTRAGGKSLIVARAIRRLGGEVTLHGFLGGSAGDIIARECQTEGMGDRHVRIGGETRTTVVIVDGASGQTTVVNEPGPEVSPADLAQLRQKLDAAVRPGDVVVLTGSLPPGAPPELYALLVDQLRPRGVPVLVDASGDPLRLAAAAGPAVLKVNVHEFEQLRPGHDLAEAGALGAAMDRVRREAGIGALIVTRGSSGALAVDGARRYQVGTPAVRTVNATGSGDSFLGALALTVARRGLAGLAEGLRLGAAAGAAKAVRLDPDIGDTAAVLALAEAVDVRVTSVAPETAG